MALPGQPLSSVVHSSKGLQGRSIRDTQAEPQFTPTSAGLFGNRNNSLAKEPVFHLWAQSLNTPRGISVILTQRPEAASNFSNNSTSTLKEKTPLKSRYTTCQTSSAPRVLQHAEREVCNTSCVCARAAAQVQRQSENVRAHKSSRGGYQAKVCAAAVWGCAQQTDCVCVCADTQLQQHARSKSPTWLISTHNVWIYLRKSDFYTHTFR